MTKQAQEIPRIDIKEFREKGYLQELNRRFLHPLGLALEVIVDGDSERFGGVWDFREDPEGMAFAPDIIDADKALHVDELLDSKKAKRIELFGSIIQPVITKEKS